jgi:hypothetical protein
MNPFDELTTMDIDKKIHDRLRSSQIRYQRESDFQEKIVIDICESSINREVLVLSIKWGHFSLECKVLNIGEANTKHGIVCSNGSYADVYIGYFLRK